MPNRLSGALRIFRRQRRSSNQTGGEPAARNIATNARRKRKVRQRVRLVWTAFDWLAYASRDRSLRLLRKNQIHVDTTLETVDGFSEQVHWQVFAALCPKLVSASLVTRPTVPICREHRKLVLPAHISGPIAHLLVECAYGEPMLSLNASNLDQLYDVVLKYKIEHALKICLDFARTLLNVHNCIYLYRLAIWHKHRKLRRACYAMIRSNFKLILHVNKDFHQLGANQLRQLLLDNQLKLNDEEEVAWLAIVRWRRRKQLTQSQLADLYNQMASGHLDVQMVHWSAQTNQVQSPLPTDAGNTNGAGPRQGEMPARFPFRLTLDFYSPANPVEPSANKVSSWSRSAAQLGERSPLRQAAERNYKSEHEARLERRDTGHLFALIKCLRFMRFKSLAAFDVIRRDEFVENNDMLLELVNHMQVAYKLRRGLTLTEAEKRDVSPKQIKRLKNYGRSRSERLREKLRLLVAGAHHRVRPRSIHRAFLEQELRAARGPAPELISSETVVKTKFGLLGQRSLERADRPRVPISVGLLIGGWQDGRLSKTIWAYDFVSDRWFKLNIKLPEPRAFHASCCSPTKGHVYIFGGTNGNAILDSALKLNLASDVYIGLMTGAKDKTILKYKFKQLRPMSERRCHLSGVFHTDGRLYALGGHNGTQRLRSGEWYDTNSNQWHAIADMTIARAAAAACSHENKIFIAGGQISDQFIQSSVEFYKSSDNTWTFAAPMIIPRMSFSMVSYKGQLLVMGGTNGLYGGEEVASVTRTVERYNHGSGSWSFCAPMLVKRHSFGALQIGNKLLAVGGHSGRRRLKTSETLRLGQFSSQSVDSLLALGRSIQNRLQRLQESSNQLSSTDADLLPASSDRRVVSASITNPLRGQLSQQQTANTGGAASARTNPTNDLLTGIVRIFGSQTSPRSAMKWVPRNNLPERRSGFSVATVQKLKNAKDYTYYGSVRQPKRARQKRARQPEREKTRLRPSFIKQPGPWQRFKIIKRRKLIKHLKIAVIVTIVILMM